jgi:hypothetical protein
MQTVNSHLMGAAWRYAEGHVPIPPDPDTPARAPATRQTSGTGGVMHAVPVTLHPGMKIYRFATHGIPFDRLCRSFWWFGFSAHDAIRELAKFEQRRLGEVARECLAVPPEWGNSMDLLVHAAVTTSLSAWSGTPRTARHKDPAGEYGVAWKPDRSITQLFIPGHRRLDPADDAIRWSDVLVAHEFELV